ncbi:MAG: succinate dehydrogenase/fumarate reductase iron-sulfur subunit [Deltaproteobacteria bacterium]|nr:succinate dehydrogenase/fumarate reductase iron-sulfur subunit [Deltaproteobacteria bacterium]MBW1962131.1 succinate dehydrogenase/fumarate reductase iron-sulfur subunit [Deltaproteobacteria bacterium]MBW2152975.1 succinate dehydrogenase/fumarate reductase iron-sulfur subunit [Deltaproteobacteria bacterium]
MTAYIPDIKNPEAMYTVYIERFDPEKDEKPYLKRYTVPFVQTMTVMEALEYLWDQGEYIAFRANCREFTCGSCAMLINGKPRLACDTLFENNMRLEPLSRYARIKDLVVDTNEVKEKLKALRYWPESKNRKQTYRVTQDALDKFHRIYSRCIECYCCLEACPASSSERSGFDGPMHLLQIARAATHPLDTLDRTRQASEHGIWSCVSCFECAGVCPMELSPGTVIAELRKRAVKEMILRFIGVGKEK